MAEPPPSLDSCFVTGTYESSSGGSDSSSYPFSPKVEGYDYDFVAPPDSRYECAICLLVLREPRQTPCGHRFCRDCILKWLRESHTRCPADNEEILEKDLFPDNFAKREIQNFTVRCPNSKQGCDVLTTVKQVSAHQNICPLALVPCPNRCTHVLLRRNLEQHITQTCDRRSIPCPDCHNSFLAVEYEGHVQSCPRGKVQCPHCGEDIVRQELSRHTEEECSKAVVSCRFSVLGCQAQMARSEMDSHLSDGSVTHLNLLCEAVTQLFRHLRIPPLGAAGAQWGPAPKEGLSSTADIPGDLSGMASLVYQAASVNAAVPVSSSDSTMEPQQMAASGWSLPHNLLLHHHHPLTSPVSSSSLDSSTTPPFPSQPTLRRSPSDPKSLLYGGGVVGGAPSMVTHEMSLLTCGSDGGDSRGLEMPPSCVGGLGVREGGAGVGGWHSGSVVSSSSVQDEQKLVVHDQKLLELQLKMDNLERNYRQKLKEMSEMEGRICNGQFFWKIRNYSRYQREAEHGETTALHSQPFYTAPTGGYKLCVRANLNGVDSARGRHLSLFIHFMQGEYDEILDWPFRGHIVLSVLDQNDCCELRNHVAETLMAKPNLAAFQKPTTPRNHKGFGYMEFLPLSALKNSSFIKSDTLIIKVHVMPNG